MRHNKSFEGEKEDIHDRISSRISQNAYSNQQQNFSSGMNYAEKKKHSTSVNFSNCQALPMLINNPKFKPRKWKMGLRDKLDTKGKYKNDSFKREQKIKRAIEKQRVKSRIGIRIQQQNRQILNKNRPISYNISNPSYHRTGSGNYRSSNQSNYYDMDLTLKTENRWTFPVSTMTEAFTSE